MFGCRGQRLRTGLEQHTALGQIQPVRVVLQCHWDTATPTYLYVVWKAQNSCRLAMHRGSLLTLDLEETLTVACSSPALMHLGHGQKAASTCWPGVVTRNPGQW